MESFYGGPKGKDFEIKQIFTSKYQMDRDLTKGWTMACQAIRITMFIKMKTCVHMERVIILHYGEKSLLMRMEQGLRVALAMKCQHP